MDSTATVTHETVPGSLGSAEIYENSTALGFLQRLHNRVESGVISFFLWFDQSFRCSFVGTVLVSVKEALESWVPSSICARVIKWVLSVCLLPRDSAFGEGTLIGLSLAIGIFLPTAVQMVCFAAVVFLLLWRRTVKYSEPENKVLPNLPFTFCLPLIILFLFVVGATIASVVPADSFKNLVFWCFSGLAFLFAFDISFKGGEENIIWPVLAGASLSSLLGIYQYFSGRYTPEAWVDPKFQDELVRIVGTFTNPNYFAEMLGLTLPLALALLIRNKDIRDKGIMLVYAGLQAIALIFTWSRGAWLGFLASFAIMAILFDKRLLVVGLVAVVVIVALAPPIILERFLSSFSLEDSSNAYRVSVWRGSWALLKDNLFRGIGLGAKAFSQLYPEYMIIQTPSFHSHNLYIQIIIEIGLFGFIALAWFLIVNIWHWLGALRITGGKGLERWKQTAILVACMSAIAGNLIQGIIEYTWYNPQVMLVFWAWLGVSTGVASSLKSARGDGIEL